MKVILTFTTLLTIFITFSAAFEDLKVYKTEVLIHENQQRNYELQPTTLVHSLAIVGSQNTDIWLINDQMDWIFFQFRMLIKDVVFDFEMFERMAGKIQERLSNIDYFISKKSIQISDLSKKVRFSKKVFETMMNATDSLTLYSFKGGSDQLYLCKIIHLNVCLFALYDEYGAPDPTIEKYAKNLARYTRHARIWEGIFGVLNNVPESTRELFEYHFSQAQEKLNQLNSQVIF